jgi:CRP-like cAMP-binding protein
MPIPTVRTAKSNRLLAALPRGSLERMVPFLHLRALSLRQVLQKRGSVLDGVLFPIAGVASMITVSDSGTSVEVATIGSEGVVGLPLFLGGQSSAAEVFVQVAGQGLFMAAAQFHRHVDTEPSLTRMLLLYTQALMTQIAQCAACASTHKINARCARWILQTNDRVAGEEFVLTHEFLGLMLGVRRATVSEAAQDLQTRGLISYRRGLLTVVDRAGLEKAACECYRLINREYARLLKPRRLS